MVASLTKAGQFDASCKLALTFAELKMWIIFALAFRAISSVGSEHLPYKQGVVGSIPTSPTRRKSPSMRGSFFVSRFEGLTV